MIDIEKFHLKKCSKCLAYKPLSEFYSNKAKPSGVYSDCKICFKSTLIYPKVKDFIISFTEEELKNEIWTDILIGDELMPYKVSDLGRVMITKTGKICKPSFDQRGYPQVVITGSKRISRRVHRLVALAYIPNPLNKREVNHIDGNKLNTRASNMEWVTSKENVAHAIQMNLRCN